MILNLEREISDQHAPSFGLELLCAVALVKCEAFEVISARVGKIFRSRLRSRRKCQQVKKLRGRRSGLSRKTNPFRPHLLSLFSPFLFSIWLTPSHLTVFV